MVSLALLLIFPWTIGVENHTLYLYSHQGTLDLAQLSIHTVPVSISFSAKFRPAWYFPLPSSSELLPLSQTSRPCALIGRESKQSRMEEERTQIQSPNWII